jgi:hypothetical protein
MSARRSTSMPSSAPTSGELSAATRIRIYCSAIRRWCPRRR